MSSLCEFDYLRELFDGFLRPEITNCESKFCIPEQFSLNVLAKIKPFEGICDHDKFVSMSVQSQRSLLDILAIIMKRGVYDVIRLQCFGSNLTTIFKTVITLLNSQISRIDTSVSKRLILLLGLIGSAGINVEDLKTYLSLLNEPTQLTTALLESLQMMLKQDSTVAKACPLTFFNLGGRNSGIQSTLFTFPFAREYQAFCWFRIEEYGDGFQYFNVDNEGKQHIFTIQSPNKKGVDFFIEDQCLALTVGFGKEDARYIRFEKLSLARRVWYHLCVRHFKPRLSLSLFAKDEFIVYLDHQQIFQEFVKFPQANAMEPVMYSCGRHFNGQMGPIYFLSEMIPMPTVELIARIDSGKFVDGISDVYAHTATGEVFADLLPNLVLPDKKTVALVSKIGTVYHPSRCYNNQTIDIHGGKHARLIAMACPWTILPARHALSSLGGISCLLVLLPRLFVENDGSGAAMGTSVLAAYDRCQECDVCESNLVACVDDLRGLIGKQRGCLSIVVSIFARALSGNKLFQKELQSKSAVDMMEFAFSCIPTDILMHEGEDCILSLLQLKTAVAPFVPANIPAGAIVDNSLECSVTKQLLCNFLLWSKSSMELQRCLMSILVAATRAQPNHFLQLIGIDGFLNAVSQHYMDDIGTQYAPSQAQLEASFPQTGIEPESTSSLLELKVSTTSGQHKKSKQRKSIICKMIEISAQLSDPSSPRSSNAGDDDVSADLASINEDDTSTISPVMSNVFPFAKGSLPVDSNQCMNEIEDQRDHRKSCRESLFMMIQAIILYGTLEKDIHPLLDFIATAQDVTVIGEVAHLLLFLLVEGGSTMLIAITSACKGPEEFASFVLFHLIHQPVESVRTIGIRLLTHYYLLVEGLPSNMLTMTLRRNKRSILSSALEKLSMNSSGNQGMRRLQACGGLVVLNELLTVHAQTWSEATYSALLEMLLTQPGSSNHISFQVSDFESALLTPGAGLRQKKFLFASHYLSPDKIQDEDVNIINPVALKLFLQLLPKFPIAVHQQIYSDLLSILKHGVGNREVFCGEVSWHVCMFELVRQLVVEQSQDYPHPDCVMLTSAGMVEALQHSSSVALSVAQSSKPHTPTGKSSQKPTADSNDFRMPSSLMLRSWASPSHSSSSEVTPVSKSIKTASTDCGSTSMSSNSASDDAIFSMGMKVYATMLLQVIDNKGGWRELERTLSQSFGTSIGGRVSQAVVSHLVNDLTFTMRSKYREIQRLAKTSAEGEAAERLDSILSVLITASQYVLHDVHCATYSIRDYWVAKLRADAIDEINRENENRPSIEELTPNPDPDVLMSEDEARQAADNPSQPPVPAVTVIDQAEQLLSMRLQQHKLQLNQQEQQGQGVSSLPVSFSENIDLDYEWTDLYANEIGKHLQSTGRSNQADSQNPFIRENLMHPLERDHEKSSGQLILTLQVLRLFDTLLWPTELGPIRNSHMFKFHKEKSQLATDIRPSGNSGVKSKNDQAQPKLTICGSYLRMAVFVMHNLSPFTDLANFNILRVRAIMAVMDKVSRTTTPVDEWNLCLTYHMSLALQRISWAMIPIYEMIGISEQLVIPTVGNYGESSHESEIKRMTQDEGKLEKYLTDDKNSNDLQSLFDNFAGKQILKFVKNLMFVLLDTFEGKMPLLFKSMEKRTFNCLSTLMERVKTDCSDTWSSTSPNKVTVNVPKENVVVTTPMLQQKESVQDGIIAPVTEESMAGQPHSPKSFSEDAINRHSFGTTNGAAAAQSTQVPVVPTPVRKPKSHEGSSDTASELSQSISDSAMQERIAVSLSIPTSNNGDERVLARDVVTILTWLREPFLRCNLLRHAEMIKAVESVNSHESSCVDAFVDDIKLMRASLSEAGDQASQLSGEIMELKDLSTLVDQHMKSRETMISMTKRTSESLRIKRVVEDWHECVHSFEDDWSPWAAKAKLPSESVVIPLELLQHKDSKMRRMLLTRNSDPIDHSDASYFEAKQRDQVLFQAAHAAARDAKNKSLELGSDGNSAVVVQPPSVETSAKLSNEVITTEDTVASQSFLAFAKLRTKANTSGKATSGDAWQDEADMEMSEDDRQSFGSAGSTRVKSGSFSGVNNLFGALTTVCEKPIWIDVFPWRQDEKVLFLGEALLIRLEQVLTGSFVLSNRCIYFHPKVQSGGLAKDESKQLYDSRWFLDRISEVYSRRYLLQSCAIELFMTDSPSVFMAFSSKSDMKQFFKILQKQSLPRLTCDITLDPRKAAVNSSWTELWRKRQISNFEYLMRLNIIAGRSYNDITQYPVFPWVIADYTSTVLDFNNPDTFRDFSKPVGALNPSRLLEFLDRYKSFDDEEIPKFMYGSHYSSAGVVVHYLIRQEPFSSMAINLQGGRLDCPDRLFFDIHRTWQGCNNSMSDVKELIPEFFCCPEMFLNSNKLPLGELQEGGVVDDVVMPPWAKDAHEFVRINREALESDYVSDNINDWIDLIFGYKQTGEAAHKSNNVFYYLTYENAIDIEAIEDPLQKEATKTQVTHFGQTPSQLFVNRHPKRIPADDCMVPVCYDTNCLEQCTMYTPQKQFGMTIAANTSKAQIGAVVSVKCSVDKLIVCHSDLTICYYKWSCFPDGDGTPFQFRADRSRLLSTVQSLSTSRSIIFKSNNCGTSGSLRKSNSEDSIKQRLDSACVEDEKSSIGGDLAGIVSDNEPKPPVVATSGGMFSAFRKGMTSLGTTLSGVGGNVDSRASMSSGGSFKRNSVISTFNTPSFASECVDSSAVTPDSGDDDCSPVPVFTGRGGMTVEAVTHNHVSLSVVDQGSGRIISCGYWDQSLKVHALDSFKEIASCASGHNGQITCLELVQQEANTIITGGDDGTCRLWILENPSLAATYSFDTMGESHCQATGATGVISSSTVSSSSSSGSGGGMGGTAGSDCSLQCVRVFCGHLAPITAMAYNVDMALLYSGSSSGLVCCHDARRGQFVRSMKTTTATTSNTTCAVNGLLALSNGHVVTHSHDSLALNLFTINGEHLVTDTVANRINCMVTNGSASIFVCGTGHGMVSVRNNNSLQLLYQWSDLMHFGPISCLTFSDDGQFLVIGSSDGTISIATNKEQRMQLLHNAMLKIPLLPPMSKS